MKGFNLDILEKTSSRHHGALLEHEKNFTLWLGVIFVMQIALLYIKHDYSLYFFLTLIFSILGILLAVIAISSVRKEGEYFKGAFDNLKNAYRKLYRENIYAKTPACEDIKLSDLVFFFYLQPFKSRSIKSLFQSLWAALIGIFVIMLMFSLVEFIRQWTGVGSQNIPYIACLYAVTLYLICGFAESKIKEEDEYSEEIEEPDQAVK